jgi:outer membrane protein assembly factor BamB
MTSVAALAEGAVYVRATDVNDHPVTTVLAALRASDGSVLWHKMLAGTAIVVATGAGVVYVALDNGGMTPHELQMLRAQNGVVLWRTQVEGTGPLHASMHEGTIYVMSFTTLLPSPGYYYASTIVYALNAGTGAVSWHTSIGRTNYLAEVAGGAVYLVDTGTDVVCDPHVLHVLSASDGAERWHSAGTLLNLIGVDQGLVYLADVPEGCRAVTYDHGALYALRSADGSSAWRSDTPFGSGILTTGALYLPASDGDVAAYGTRSGFLLWRVRGESGHLYVFNGVLYTSVPGAGLDALNPANGAVQWHFKTRDVVSLSTVANGILYGVIRYRISDSLWNQAVVALRASTGELLWRFHIGASEDTPIVG